MLERLSQARTRVVVVADPNELDSHLPAWWELHANRLEDNLCASPAFLAEIYRHYGKSQRCGLAFVYRRSLGSDELLACAPLGSVGGVLPRVLRTCDHDFVTTATPLLHRDHADDAVAGLCEWLERPLHPWSMACWSHMGLDSAAWTALSRHLDERRQRYWIRRRFDRPAIRCRPEFGAYLDCLSSKRRTAWRASSRRLAAAGEVVVNLHRNLHDFDLVRRFLAIEASGWKGEAGSAMADSQRDRDFFSAMTQNLARRNELYFVEVVLDGVPISITANYVDGHTAYGFKIACDPAYRRFGPGFSNLMEVARLVHEDPLLRGVSSGSEEGSFSKPFWRDSEPVGHVLIATRGVAADFGLRVMPVARQSVHAARAAWSALRSGAA